MGRNNEITVDLHVPFEIRSFLCEKSITLLYDGWHVILNEMRHGSGINLLLSDTAVKGQAEKPGIKGIPPTG
jgi:hypothetical protein